MPCKGGKLPPWLASVPQPIEDPENDEGLKCALQFRLTCKASKDMYSSQVVQIISTKRQIVTGVKYFIEAEIAQDTRHATHNFIVLNVPWQNQEDLLESKCQAVTNPKSTQPSKKDKEDPNNGKDAKKAESTAGRVGHTGWVDSFFYGVVSGSVVILVFWFFLHYSKKAVGEIFLVDREKRLMQTVWSDSNRCTSPLGRELTLGLGLL